jgi:hypothetical protein
MQNYIIGFFIFCLVLFFYLHIVYHLKTSNDLEVYVVEQPSKDKLEEICDLRQPLIFDYNNDQLLENINIESLDKKYGSFDIKIRDVNEVDKKTELYVPLLFKESLQLFENDKSSKFITEKNSDFLEETCAIKEYRYNDYFLRPPFVAKCIYDFMSGSVNTKTPLRYDLNYRNYYLVTSGKINIKLVSPQYSKYLYENRDYDNLEFNSPLNLWDIQQEYKLNFEKIKILDVTLERGQIIYIPAYWWYTIDYENISSICSFKYRTYMNTLAISPHLITAILQNQNIKLNSINKLEIDEKNMVDKNDTQSNDLDKKSKED